MNDRPLSKSGRAVMAGVWMFATLKAFDTLEPALAEWRLVLGAGLVAISLQMATLSLLAARRPASIP